MAGYRAQRSTQPDRHDHTDQRFILTGRQNGDRDPRSRYMQRCLLYVPVHYPMPLGHLDEPVYNRDPIYRSMQHRYFYEPVHVMGQRMIQRDRLDEPVHDIGHRFMQLRLHDKPLHDRDPRSTSVQDGNLYNTRRNAGYRIGVENGITRLFGQSFRPTSGPETTLSFPPHWEFDGVNPIYDVSGCTLVEVTNTGNTKAEFDKLEKQFQETVFSYKLKSIKRIQNYKLWEKYCQRKSCMETKLAPGQTVREESLFHGTKARNIEAICMQGFKSRLAGTSTGTRLGMGCYFSSKSAWFASHYTDCKTVFMAYVLVGESTLGQAVYVKPPPKDPAKPHENLYDSCVDNEQKPKTYVVYNDDQIYPAYLLEY